jgi:hypothetical protein
MYNVAINVWNEDGIVLTDTLHHKLVGLHYLFGYGGDSQSNILMHLSIHQILLMEVLELVVERILSHQGENNHCKVYTDGISGSYFFEWFWTAAGLDKRVSAAALCNALTPSSDVVLCQNVSGQTIKDPNYPIT